MVILGIGVDILAVSRLRALSQRRGIDRLAARILSSEEKRQWQDGINTVTKRDQIAEELYLAVRWSAKEAAYKALYPSIKVSWNDLVVSKQHLKPLLTFSQKYLSAIPSTTAIKQEESQKRLPQLHLSLSHEEDYVLAYCIAET